jgi:peptidyl-prolyl cis-trans isomerase C
MLHLIRRGLLFAGVVAFAMQVTAEPAVEPITLVKVDGEPVTNLHLALFASQTGRAPDDAEGQISLLNELVNHVMIANSEEGLALAVKPEVIAALEVARARLIAQTFVRDRLEAIQITDQQILDLYQSRYEETSGKEYKARHILLATEEEAEAVIDKLQKGADFAATAESESIGPSKSVGGDLGWFETNQMVAEFSQATEQLAEGEFNKVPVKTQFGWHVILLEQSRAVAPPELDTVKEELVAELRQQQIASEISIIRQRADIEVQSLD